MSQKALGMLFSPSVTTQFISNVERGVTPLPPAHIPTLAKALQIPEAEMMGLLEREYTLKLSGRLGLSDETLPPGAGSNGSIGSVNGGSPSSFPVQGGDYSFMKNVYEAYRHADPKTRQAFLSVCESILNIPKTTVSIENRGS